MTDPLEEVLRAAFGDWSSQTIGSRLKNDLIPLEAAAVRAFLAAVLDAEEARWHYGRAPASEVIDSIRSALGVVEPVAKEAEGGR